MHYYNKKKLLAVIFIISVMGNILFFCADGLFCITVLKGKIIEREYSKQLSSIDEFKDILYENSLQIIESGKRTFAPTKIGYFYENLKFNFAGYSKKKLYSTGEMGYLMIAVLEEAIRRNDIKGIERIKKVFDRECLNDSLFQIDQTLNGIVATKLYCHTNDYKYLAYSNRMYNWLKSLFIPEIGILYRSKETFQIVDGLGMYIPFLVNYAEIKDSTESLLIVKQSVEWYIKYGIDKDTGIPAHGVQIFSPFLKKGSINWGRGCSWWALALCCINDEMLDVENREIVLKFKDTILNLYHSQGYFSQFLSDKGQIDLTSTIPLLFYLTDMKVLSATDDFKLSFSKYLHNGVLYYSSGPTEGLNRYSPFSGENLLAQAIMLKWLNIN